MTVDQFFEKFELFADAPDAIDSIRKLILKLAIRGKLVAQDCRDEPAETLFARIRTSRKNLDDNGQLKTKVELPEIRHGDAPYTIPDSWLWVPLNEIAELVYGKLLPTADLLPNGFDVFGANGIIGKYSKYHYDNEMLLISCRGAYSGTPNISPRKCYVTNNSIVCEFFDTAACDIRFYFAAISVSPRDKIVTGSAQPQVTVANALKLPVPLPPLAEQKRIVGKVDELMSLCDRLESEQALRAEKHAAVARAALARFAENPSPQNLEYLFHKNYHINPADLRKSILTMAVQGKLVEQDERDESIHELLKKMKEKRNQLVAQGTIRKPILHFPPDKETEPFQLPESWCWEKWGNISDWITYGFTRPMAHVESGPLIVTAKNVRDGFICLEDTDFADENEFDSLRPKDRPRKGDILIVKDGATIGRAAIVDIDKPFCISQTVAVLWLGSCKLDRRYLLMVIQSPFAQTRIWAAAEGAAMPHLSITDFGKMPLPLPPFAEQKRIVAKVDQLMTLVDQLTEQQSRANELAEQLMEAAVAELTASG